MKILAMVLLAAFSMTAQAAQWNELFSINVPAVHPFIKDRFLIDVSSLQWRGAYVKYWVKLVYQDPQVRNNIAIKSDMEEHVLDCARRTMATVRHISFDAGGRRVVDTGQAPASAEDIQPDTLGEKEYRFVCPQQPGQDHGNIHFL